MRQKAPPAKHKGGAPQTWNPKVIVRLAFTPESAAYFKARMDEEIEKMRAARPTLDHDETR